MLRDVHNSPAFSHFPLKAHLHPDQEELMSPECHGLGFGLRFYSTAKWNLVLLTFPFNYKIRVTLIEFLTVILESH